MATARWLMLGVCLCAAGTVACGDDGTAPGTGGSGGGNAGGGGPGGSGGEGLTAQVEGPALVSDGIGDALEYSIDTDGSEWALAWTQVDGGSYAATGEPIVNATPIPAFGFFAGNAPALVAIGDQVGVAFTDADPENANEGGELYFARVTGL